MNLPFVSIIIPCRNEEGSINRCLDSVLAQDYPQDKIEVLVVDGMSDDRTRDIVKELTGKNSGIVLLDNPCRIVPKALNIGVKASRGEFIVRMDAHSLYERDYVSQCVEFLQRGNFANVGGPMRAVGEDYMGKAIALCHHSFFGLGGGKFHDEEYEGLADTVYLGAFRRDIFDKVGLFDERLERNQDIEFNARIRKNGGKIYLTSVIRSVYRCRSGLAGLWKQNFRNGLWAIYTKAIAPYALSWRHFVPFVFFVCLTLSLLLLPVKTLPANLRLLPLAAVGGSYLAASLFFSLTLSLRKGGRYFFILPVIFATLHFSYGMGSVLGLFKIITAGRNLQERPMTGKL